MKSLRVVLPRPHPKQAEFLASKKKRRVLKAGRRSGKTTVVAIFAVMEFLRGKKVLYAVPTADQFQRFWRIVCRSLAPLVAAGAYHRNDSRHIIGIKDSENFLHAKTAWNADTLRSDNADVLILDEWQLMNESAWNEVGAPMLLDTDGTGVFVFTPPRRFSRSATKADDPMHAVKMFRRACDDPKWDAFRFTSFDNPYLSKDALDRIAEDMTSVAYRREILAEDVDEVPGALWTREVIERNRVEPGNHPPLIRIAVGVDPSGGGHDCGIVAVGISEAGEFFVLADRTTDGTPKRWASSVFECAAETDANVIVAETNFGGKMVREVLESVGDSSGVPIREVSASRGKAVRAEPVSALYERGLVHHVGAFPELEDELTTWVPGMSKESPNRMDALVWAVTFLRPAKRSAAVVVKKNGPEISSRFSNDLAPTII